MSADQKWLYDEMQKLRDAGGQFVRYSSAGHQLWKLGPSILTFPGKQHQTDRPRLRQNIEAQVRRAIAKYGTVPVPTTANGAAPVMEAILMPLPDPAPPTPPLSTTPPATPPAAPSSTPRPPRFTCPHCAVTSTTGAGLSAHIRFSHTPRTTTPCPTCDKLFIPSALGVHRRRAHHIVGQSPTAQRQRRRKARGTPPPAAPPPRTAATPPVSLSQQLIALVNAARELESRVTKAESSAVAALEREARLRRILT